MTITTRSKRVSPFAAAGNRHHATPAAVGPGAYSPEKALTSFPNAVNADDDGGGAGGGLTGSRVATRPLFSGFATSEKRHMNENRTTSAYTPGGLLLSLVFGHACRGRMTELCERVRTWRVLVVALQRSERQRAVERLRNQGKTSM